MFSKFSLGIMFVAVLISAGFWIIQKDGDESATENRSSANKKDIVADIKIRKPKQQNKQSIKGTESKKKKLDRMLTPDELYEQQFTSSRTEFELEPTIPDLEVMPEELKILEEESTIASVSSETIEEDVFSDNLDFVDDNLLEGELPPSEDYAEIIPFELEQMEIELKNIESKFNKVVGN